MAPRLNTKEYFVLVVIILLFGLSIGKYFYTQAEQIGAFRDDVVSRFDNVGALCADGEEKQNIGRGGYVCVSDDSPSVYFDIFTEYPRTNKGKDTLYSFLDKGNIEIADKYLENTIVIPRYDDLSVETIQWTEDPYGEPYWRFLHYSLRETRHLLFAWKETGDVRYYNKLTELLNSFLDEGTNQNWAWDDKHGVAYRAMVLTNVWWELREENALSQELSTKILMSIEEHMAFLARSENYEGNYNHAVTQASALFLSGINFAELDKDEAFANLGKQRLQNGIVDIIDADGVLVENSPYYHFYTLEKYWELYEFSREHNASLGRVFQNKVDAMIAYGTYIIQPNASMPLLGASIERIVAPQGYYREISETNDEFRFAISKGEDGDKPSKQHTYFDTAGRTMLRSGWGEDRPFEDETQIIFDVGPYRTNHSDLDAFTFSLYSNGAELIVDPGLFTYEDGNKKDYFRGTHAHNTVSVDGKDQKALEPYAGEIEVTRGAAHQTAVHTLYNGVTHYRTLALLEHDLVLVIDHLISDEEHDYTQVFRLHPEAELELAGLTAHATRENGNQQLEVRQLHNTDGITATSVKGETTPYGGWCSVSYEVEVPCYSLEYSSSGKEATFVTLLKIGNEDKTLQTAWNSEKREAKISYGRKTYEFNLSLPSEQFEYIHNEIAQRKSQTGQLVHNGKKWLLVDEKGSELTDYKVFNDDGLVSIKTPKSKLVELTVATIGTHRTQNGLLYTNIPYDTNVSTSTLFVQEDFVPIFGYHDLLPDKATIEHPTLQMHVSDFEAQVAFATDVLKCNWYTISELAEDYIIPERKIPQNACAMNFDDGNASDYDLALPVLDKYGVKATFYIIPGRLGQSGAYMTWDEVDALFRAGHEIGSHTFNSGSLVTAGWTADEIRYQLEEARHILEERGYGEIKTFAYPLGDWNNTIVNLVKDTGHIAARDTSVDNSWRDRRTTTVNFDDNFIWHLHYHKPELDLPADTLGDKLGYTSWWQFEEGFRTDVDFDGDIVARTSITPTETSFATLELDDFGDGISNKFIAPTEDTYNLSILASVPRDAKWNPAFYMDGARIYPRIVDTESCMQNGNLTFCIYSVSVELTEGTHTLSVVARDKDFYLDKFNLARELEPANSFDIALHSEDRNYIISFEEQEPQSLFARFKAKSGFLFF